jgi:hypothetical protein
MKDKGIVPIEGGGKAPKGPEWKDVLKYEERKQKGKRPRVRKKKAINTRTGRWKDVPKNLF